MSENGAEIPEIFEQTSMTMNNVDGGECSTSGETDLGEHDESKFENYTLHWGCSCACKWAIYAVAYILTLVC